MFGSDLEPDLAPIGDGSPLREASGRLRVESVSHHFGTVAALRGVSIDAESGEFLTLLGASGSGKTTLLRIIGGLILPSAGRIRVGERDITRLPPERRDIGFVFQNYALFPHMTVAENVGFALKVRRLPATEIARRVQEVLSLVDLAGFGHRYPGQLSGGQQQRVAVARAIVFRPRVLLLDEPLGALDRQLRQQLGMELRSLQRRSGITMVYVTHDQEEAFTLSTQVAVMNEGTILQVGTPQAIYRRPANLFVAGFVGEVNTFDGVVMSKDTGGMTVCLPEGISLRASPNEDVAVGARVRCVVRPEHVVVGQDADRPGPVLRARVQTIIFGGSWHRLHLALEPSGQIIRAEGRGEPRGIAEGAMVVLRYDSENVLAFRLPGEVLPVAGT
jgi:spermidine/putrescine ABC transporter ATP-binding subunit